MSSSTFSSRNLYRDTTLDVRRWEIGMLDHKVDIDVCVELILGTPGVSWGHADSCWADTHNWNREGGDKR